MGPPEIDPAAPFRWPDGERVVHYGAGALDRASEQFDSGYTLLSTRRAQAAASNLVARAATVHDVPEGRVDEVAAELRPRVAGQWLVALGGGRVIDVAKALAAADPPRRVAAVPTTLSAAEMTSLHRHAAGVPSHTPHVRPVVVINDPALSASQPEPALTASALNALSTRSKHRSPPTLTRSPRWLRIAAPGCWRTRSTGRGPTATPWRWAPCWPATPQTPRGTDSTT